MSKGRGGHGGKSSAGPMPQTTIEAILYCIRMRGQNSLQEPANLELLSRCDAAALAQIDTRMSKLRRGAR
jgi:hypothetical protein